MGVGTVEIPSIEQYQHLERIQRKIQTWNFFMDNFIVKLVYMNVGIRENLYVECTLTFLKIQTMIQTCKFCDGQSYSSCTFLHDYSLTNTIIKDLGLLYGQWHLVHNIVYLKCIIEYGFFFLFILIYTSLVVLD